MLLIVSTVREDETLFVGNHKELIFREFLKTIFFFKVFLINLILRRSIN